MKSARTSGVIISVFWSLCHDSSIDDGENVVHFSMSLQRGG